jgi:hypothetical protein
MKGTAKYYEVVKDLIDEVCLVFDRPSLFHLGMDEEDMPSHKKGMTIIRCNDLWFHDLYFYMDCVEKNGVRPWIYGDYYYDHPEGFEENVPKSCVISHGWFERIILQPDGTYPKRRTYEAYRDTFEMGYDQIPVSSDWTCQQNTSQQVFQYMECGYVNEHLLGFNVCPMQATVDINLYSLLNNAHRLCISREMFEESYPET